MNLAIETHNLGKRYDRVTAVEDLSLRVAEGEIYAFLGLNGAGKTTTIRLLLGMVHPTSGRADVLGRRVHPGSREPWADVGYLVEAPHAYPELTVRENLEVARRLHPGTPPKSIDQVIECLDLAVYADRRAGTLSTGNAQRLGLAKALLHQPKLLILDEPANGLDPAGIVEIRQLLLELTQQRGMTVFMSSHILAEVSRLARRIGIIHQGHLLQELEVDELWRQRRRLLLQTHNLETAREVLIGAGHPAAIVPDAFSGDGNLLEPAIELKNGAAIDHPEEVAALLVRAAVSPRQLIVEEEDLERYFLRLVGINGGTPHV